MKLLIDMNLSPEWVRVFNQYGIQSEHWLNVGNPKAPDNVILSWAYENGYIVFTHDLDFGAILAVTHAKGPSVIQVRTQNVTPDHLGSIVINTIQKYSSLLEEGALIVLDETRLRARVLPLKPSP